ncbi:unnamed protein product [Mytilus edulis]|uniref:IPT/TIG domain-containing protein n=1 Tax=Mytilus edulis TaxID=6550 RepID=A0A8S3U8N1_MYTED|nr:unnamed protein product [Mytilus edulis]
MDSIYHIKVNLTPFGKATQGPKFGIKGKPENAIYPPISNKYNEDICTKSWTDLSSMPAWWMFEFSTGMAYVTDIMIYYRENYGIRMSGFQLYVTNTSTIPPADDYLCYEDHYSSRPPFPNTTQKIPCNRLGQYVIYYDSKGSDEGTHVDEAIVELCYVAINGCPKTFWGNTCEMTCPKSCIEQHCFPENGSCILGGCSDEHCLNRNCDRDSAICYDGCKENRTGPFCNKYNIAFNSSILLHSNVNKQTSLVSDGNMTSCVTTQGSDIWVQVDIKEISIVTDIYLKIRVHTINTGNHTFYASNTSGLSEHSTVLYSDQSIPSAIKVTTHFRYLIYVPLINDKSSLEICEIGIVGCPPAYYSPLCTKMCPVNCKGPCDLVTGTCKYGCSSGWIGDTCNIDADCVINPEHSIVVYSPKIYEVYPSSGPVNGGTLLTITGKYIGNVSDSIYVEVSGVRCHNVIVATPGINFTCIIGEGNTNKTEGIFVSVNANNFSDSNVTYFSFKKPMILDFSPKKGIIAGGTTVSVRGVDIGFEGQNRYNISFCDNEICIECSAYQNTFNSAFISFKTGKSGKPRNITLLHMVIDDLTVITHTDMFLYLPDPKFDVSNESKKTLQSGGPFSILGEGFGIVGNVTVRGMGEICYIKTDTNAVCEIPSRKQNESYNQTLFVHFDGAIFHITIEYVEDPTFEHFKTVLEYDKESTIEIKGQHILTVARREDYSVHIGLDGKCIITNIAMTFITCLPPKSVPRTYNTDENTVGVTVEVMKIMAYIGDLQYTEYYNNFSLIIGLTTGLVACVIIGIFAILIFRRYKKSCYKMQNGNEQRNSDKLDHTEEHEMIYYEINPDDELQSNTSKRIQQDVNEGYADLAHRSSRDPYNQLQQESADNRVRDMIHVDTHIEDLSNSGYISVIPN